MPTQGPLVNSILVGEVGEATPAPAVHVEIRLRQAERLPRSAGMLALSRLKPRSRIGTLGRAAAQRYPVPISHGALRTPVQGAAPRLLRSEHHGVLLRRGEGIPPGGPPNRRRRSVPRRSSSGRPCPCPARTPAAPPRPAARAPICVASWPHVYPPRSHPASSPATGIGGIRHKVDNSSARRYHSGRHGRYPATRQTDPALHRRDDRHRFSRRCSGNGAEVRYFPPSSQQASPPSGRRGARGGARDYSEPPVLSLDHRSPYD